ncbi:MAG: V-type ATP synthase subunit I [Thermoplasmatales archaeon]|nr:MAG: V-type ATP synthase subunit I [Thermoplasmatales archaeon]
MKKASLIIHQSYLEDIIQKLHETGLMEIIEISRDEPDLLKDLEQASMFSDAGICANYNLRVARLIGILKGIQPKKGGIKGLLQPQLPQVRTVESRSIDELFSYTEGILNNIEKSILDYDKQLNDYNDQIEKIKTDIENVNYLKDFNFDISGIGESEYVIVKAGLTSDLPTIENEIIKLDKTYILSKIFGKGKKQEWAIVLIGHISEKEKIEKISREKITEFDIKHLSGTPKKVLDSLKKEKQEINKKKNKVIADLRFYAEEQLHDLMALNEEIYLEQVRKEISKNFGKTNTTYVIKGWILEKNQETLKTTLTNVSKDHIIFDFTTPSANPDNPPVYLETPNWAKAFRTFLDLFATPRYNEIDPMIFMGIFFVIFFGIMLGDAGYGLCLLFLSLFGYIKLSKYSETIKNWSFMGIWLGFTTTIVGFLTNSIFGDLIPRFFFNNPDYQFYSFSIAGVQFPIEPLKNPLIILGVALFFGLIHLNFGIILAVYQSYKNKKYKTLITEHFSWFPIQIGGGMLIGAFLLKMWSLGTIETYIALIMFIIGIIFRIINAGPLGLFDITGYIGDWLSYARLLALGLGTTGMALAFNIVAQIIPEMIPVVGIIFVPIILIIAHIANLGLQTLGAGVHSLRLQYVEFFNRFYSGGGKKFEPFSIKRKYTKLKEGK